MIGEKLREARQKQQLSLNEVSTRAGISAATLSRIENEKQALDVEMLVVLSRILGVRPEAMVSSSEPGSSEHDRDLAQQIEDLPSADRMRLWRRLASSLRPARGRAGRNDTSARLEELLAQVDFLRQEIESVKARLQKRT